MLGCGSSTLDKVVYRPDTGRAWTDVTRVDINPDCKPDIVLDIGVLPLPFETGAYDEVHAYEVLEHIGTQGDWRFFFAHFDELWRILKPGGYLFGTSPRHDSPWAWGDPGHTRIISRQALTFLDRTMYGVGPMTDYRAYYRGDFALTYGADVNEHQHAFALQAIKPVRG